MTIVCRKSSRRPSFGSSLVLVAIGIVLKSILDDFVISSQIFGQEFTTTIPKKWGFMYLTTLNGSIVYPEAPIIGVANVSKETIRIILENQIHRQEVFQSLLFRNQHPTDCRTRRILFTEIDFYTLDGFALEFQFYARHLQAAMAMDRTFIFRDNFRSAYEPPNCQWSTSGIKMSKAVGWLCLYEPTTNCTESTANEKQRNPETGRDEPPPSRVNASASLMTAYGIHAPELDNVSEYYNAALFGPMRVVDGLTFHRSSQRHWYMDVLQHWERVMGRFWVRAQMAHYLWRPSIGLQREIDLRMPARMSSSRSDDSRYIGIHIRFTDNVGDLLRDFGRDAHLTRSLGHFMAIAGGIRDETGISTVYLATDSSTVLRYLENSTYSQQGWSFHMQNADVVRSESHQLMWFRDSRPSMAAGIGTDVEVLRRADYLIGSHQSNVFRLATELNTAFHVGKYPLDMNRHRTVDVEWYEDP